MNSMTYASGMAGIDGCGCPMMSQKMGDEPAWDSPEVKEAENKFYASKEYQDLQSKTSTTKTQESGGGSDTMSWLGPILGKVIEAGGKIGASALAPEQKTTIVQQPGGGSSLPMGTIAIIGGGLLLVVLIVAMSGKQSAPAYPMPVYYPPQQPASR